VNSCCTKTIAGGALCGNDIINDGEVCDGSEVRKYKHGGHYVSDIKDTIVYFGEKGKIDIDDEFCTKAAGTDCNDDIDYSEDGWCSDDCKTYRPKVTCIDNEYWGIDLFANEGRGVYRGPKFWYDENGEAQITNEGKSVGSPTGGCNSA